MENRSYIAQISYKIEDWLYEGFSIEEIHEKIILMQETNPLEFPENLVLVDAYFDKFAGSSGCAFLDTNTGETIVGFVDTNLNNGDNKQIPILTNINK